MYSKESKDKNILTGALTLAISVIIVKVIGFVYKLPLSYILGDEGMGYFNTAYTVFTFFYMIAAGGLPRAVSILITESGFTYSKSDADYAVIILLKMFFKVGVALCAVTLIFARAITLAVGNPSSYLALIFVSPSIIFVSISGVIRGYMNAEGRLSSIAISEVIEGVIKFIIGLSLALWSYRRGFNYQTIAAFTILGVSLGSFISCMFLFVSYKTEKTNEKEGQKCELTIKKYEVITSVLKKCCPIALSSAIMSISAIIDLGLIMRRLSEIGIDEKTAVIQYGNYTTLVIPMLNLVSAITAPISTAALPHLTETNVKKSIISLASLGENTVYFLTLITAPLSLGFAFFPENILSLLFEDSSAYRAAPLLCAISFSAFFLPLLTLLNTMLEAVGKAYLGMLSTSLGAILKLALSYILIGRKGILGAPIGTSAAYALSAFISLIFVVYFLELPFKILSPAIINSTLAFIAVGGARLILTPHLASHSPIGFIAAVMLSAIIYVSLACIFMHRRIFGLFESVKIAKKYKAEL